MKISRLMVVGLLLTTCSFVLAQEQERLAKFPTEQDKQTATEVNGQQPSKSKIENDAVWKKLQEKVDLEIDEMPFGDVIELLREKGLNVVLDQSAEDDMLTIDDPVSISVFDVKFRTALKLMLWRSNATYVIRDGMVLVISWDVAYDPEYFARRIYDVRKLLAKIREESPEQNASQLLTDLIKSTVAPDDWDDTNGDGAARIGGGRLVVLQSQEHLYQVEDFVKDYAYELMNEK